MTGDDLLVVFLDANVLAKPVTRTLMLRCAASGYTVRWSRTAEEEADRHVTGRQLSVSGLRALVEIKLSPTGVAPERFTETSPDDRQILADAEAARATFLVTEDVNDFAQVDLRSAGVSAVNPDLFLAARADRDVYRRALEVMVSGMTEPSRSPAELHAAIARQHPRLFQRHRTLFDVEPQTTGHRQPSRGGSTVVRCAGRLQVDGRRSVHRRVARHSSRVLGVVMRGLPAYLSRYRAPRLSAGNIVQVRATEGTGQIDNQCFSHDYRRQFKEAWTPNSDTCGVATRSQLSWSGPSPYWTSGVTGTAGKTRSRADRTPTTSSTST